jgi:hypothetical protein
MAFSVSIVMIRRGLERLYWRWFDGGFSLWKPLRRWLNLYVSKAQYKGISIVDHSFRSLKDEARSEIFVLLVKEALQLIERSDPLRFRRVQKEVVFVMSVHSTHSGGTYHRYLRQCDIDFDRWRIMRKSKMTRH